MPIVAVATANSERSFHVKTSLLGDREIGVWFPDNAVRRRSHLVVAEVCITQKNWSNIVNMGKF